MHICNCGHECIVHCLNKCPLCNLREHNDVVHDFIESKGKVLVNELVAYQHRNSSAKEERRITVSQHTQLAISALRGALSNLPVSLILTDEILQHCERELKQQADAS